MISNAQQIKDSANIVEVIGSDIQLKRKGTNHVGNCPFHDEKTASFTVSATKGIYKCFGCGQSGDAVQFAMDHRNLTYPLALEHVAKVSGISVEYDESIDRKDFLAKVSQDRARSQGIITSLETAYQIYERQTPYRTDLSAPDTRIDVYLDRKYQRSTLDAFRIAAAPDSNILSDTITDVDIRSHLRTVAWIRASAHSTENAQYYYDMFRARLLFPILDIKGRIIAISGRDITGKSDSKYINSTDSDVFSKSEVLYGLYQAFRPIRDKGFAYIVEGNTDVLALHDHGICNVVAPLGTSLTSQQASVLARHTDRVIIAYDHDALSKDVIQRATELLIEQGMFVEVLELPEGQDPDSLVRDRGSDGWAELIDPQSDNQTLYDGLEWIILQMPRNNNHDKEAAKDHAIRLIALIELQGMRDRYCQSIAKIISCKISDMNRGVNDLLSDKNSKSTKLKPYQEKDANEYGVYVDDDRFYKATNGMAGYALSNFIIKPIMLIKGSETSQRLVELRNVRNERDITSIDSDDFVTLSSMRKKTERLGAYIFRGKDDDYMSIKEMIYDKTPTCYPISTMGLHKRGFWTWGNGITTPEGEFIKTNNYGIVDYEDYKYFLPTFSEIKQNIEGDDTSNEDDPGEYYVYIDKTPAPSFREWADQFVKVFGPNGQIGVLYYIASIYRDIIFKKLRYFPHLNLFGPPGSGKTYMGWRLSAMQGILRDPIDLPNTSIAGLSRQFAQKRNGFIWCDEYTSNLLPAKVDLLKTFADGVGRSLAQKSQNNNSTKTPVNAACIISGQVLPVQDPALFTRLITLMFRPFSADKAQRIEAAKLEAWEDGRLSQLTAQLHTYRPLIMKKFSEEFRDTRDTVNSLSTKPIMERLVNSYSVILTVMSILAKEISFPFKTADILDFVKERLESQHDLLQGVDELAGFFGVIKFLLESKAIGSDDVIIEEVMSVKVDMKGKDTRDITFAQPKRIIFLPFDSSFGYYRTEGKRQGMDRLFDKNDLLYYLKINSSHIGTMRGKSFNGKTRRCMVFYADQLPVHFECNKYSSAEEEARANSHNDTDAHSPPSANDAQAEMSFPHKEIKEKEDLPF